MKTMTFEIIGNSMLYACLRMLAQLDMGARRDRCAAAPRRVAKPVVADAGDALDGCRPTPIEQGYSTASRVQAKIEVANVANSTLPPTPRMSLI